MKIFRLHNKSKTDIDTIIEGCRRRESAAQELLFRQIAPRILTTCRRYEMPSFGAKDILQETFIKVFKNIHQFDGQRGNIEMWVKRIAINVALKESNKRKIKFLELEETHEQISSSIVKDVEEVSDEYIFEVIKELPEGYRMVFNLFVIDGYMHNEIGEILGIKASTSKSQLVKARRMLRMKINIFKKKVN